MTQLTPQIQLFFTILIFISVVLLHFTKRDFWSVVCYMVQSGAIAFLLILSSLEHFTILLLITISATIAVKLIAAPYFFFGLIKLHDLKSSANSYLNKPLTLLVITTLVGLTQTNFFKPLIYLTPSGQNLLSISIATILVSLFLSINKRGALSQALGILSLENGIVSFALFAGLEQSPTLQLGITFNIFIWVVVASVFTSMIFRQFGSLDVSQMKGLKE